MRVIDPAWTVNDLLELVPGSAIVLHRLGIDTCCGGSLTLAAATASAGTSVEAIASDLFSSLQPAPGGDACAVRW